MCLGELAMVHSIDANGALIVDDSAGHRQLVTALALDGPVHRGDWVLVHCGFALSVVPNEQALTALAIRGFGAP